MEADSARLRPWLTLTLPSLTNRSRNTGEMENDSAMNSLGAAAGMVGNPQGLLPATQQLRAQARLQRPSVPSLVDPAMEVDMTRVLEAALARVQAGSRAPYPLPPSWVAVAPRLLDIVQRLQQVHLAAHMAVRRPLQASCCAAPELRIEPGSSRAEPALNRGGGVHRVPQLCMPQSSKLARPPPTTLPCNGQKRLGSGQKLAIFLHVWLRRTLVFSWM
jgi:hypothetical protein